MTSLVLNHSIMASKELVNVYNNLSQTESKYISREMLLHVPILDWLDSQIGKISYDVDVGLENIVGEGWRLHNYLYDYDIGKASKIWFDPFVDKQLITEFALKWVK